MSDNIEILYVGKDEGFWTDIQAKYKAMYPLGKFNYTKMYGAGQELYGSIFSYICTEHPNIVYIDFSVDPVDCLYLAKLIKRESTLTDIAIVGLMDYLKVEEQTFKAVFTGIPFCHIKGGDYFSKVYDPLFLVSPDDTRPPHFATAKVDDSFKVKEIMRVGYIQENILHIEGNTSFKEDFLINLEQTIFDKKMMPSSKFKIVKKGNENLYYDYNFMYDLEMQYRDMPPLKKDDDGKEIALTDDELVEHKELVESVKSRVNKWVGENSSAGNSKSTKVLVIDRKLQIYEQSDKRLDQYDYSFRSQIHIRQFDGEISKYRPDIIVYRMEDPKEIRKEQIVLEQEKAKLEKRKPVDPTENGREFFNDQFNFQRLIASVKSVDGYSPFILIFADRQKTSDIWQGETGYKKIIAMTNELSLDMILNIAEKYQGTLQAAEDKILTTKLDELKKQNYNKYRKLTVEDLKEKRVFFGKSDNRSWAFYSHNVILKEINEVELFFYSDTPFAMFTTLMIDDPLNFFITISPMDKASKWAKEKNMYRGLIHIIGEKEIAELRQFINKYFFKDKNAAEEKDKEEFDKKNQEYLEKQETNKKSDDESEAS